MNRTFILLAFIIFNTNISIGQNKNITYPYTWTTTENPIVKHIYACDPSAKAFSDGNIWVFASHDADNATNYSSMRDYHIFSTKDLKTWTDYGVGLSLNDISWANSHSYLFNFLIFEKKNPNLRKATGYCCVNLRQKLWCYLKRQWLLQ